MGGASGNGFRVDPLLRIITRRSPAGSAEAVRTRKHAVVPLLQSVQTLRFELFHRAALLVRPGGKARLPMTDNLPTRQTFTRIANALAGG